MTRIIEYRDALNEAMSEEMRRDERVFLLGEEVARVEALTRDVGRARAPHGEQVGRLHARAPQDEHGALEQAVAVGPVMLEVDRRARSLVLAGRVDRRRVAEFRGRVARVPYESRISTSISDNT